MRAFWVGVVGFFSVGTAEAQENYGSLSSNYTPTNSVFINPSSMLDSKTWLDINLVGVGVFGMNNLASLDHTNYGRIIRTQTFPEDVEYHQGKKKYHAYNRNFVQGPAAVWSQGDHAAGLSFGGRSFTDARGITDYMGRFIEFGVQAYDPQHNINYSLEKVRVNTINFGEIKGSYAYTFLKKKRDMWMVGISVSKFISMYGSAANVKQFDFNIQNDTAASVFNLESDAMYMKEANLNAKGGMGLDIGFTYQRMLRESVSYFPNSKRMGCRSVPYLYTIGFSIMDIGSVKFDEDAGTFIGYNFQNYNWQQYADADFNGDNPADLFLSQESSPGEGFVKKPFKIKLPTFVSLQVDYNVWASRVYANLTWVQGLPHGQNTFGVRRANSIALTPRFESRFFDLALPLSLYEYRYPQIGISARLWFLTIGTDKLLSWIAKTDVYGGDIYAHIKIPIMYHPKCKSKMKSASNYSPEKLRRRSHDCDAYN
jgi:hypothetical protein